MTPAPKPDQYGYGVASQTGLDPTQKITGLYNELLGRAPDAEGLDYWTNAYTRGNTSLNDIRQGFMNSPEYAQRMASTNVPQTPSSPLDYLNSSTPETVLVNPPDVNYPTVDSGYGYLNPPDVATQPPYFTTLPLDPSQADYSRFLNPPEVARPSEEDFYYSRFLNPPEVARPSVEDFAYSTFLNPPDVAKPPPPPPVQTTFPQLPITIEPPRKNIPIDSRQLFDAATGEYYYPRELPRKNIPIDSRQLFDATTDEYYYPEDPRYSTNVRNPFAGAMPRSPSGVPMFTTPMPYNPVNTTREEDMRSRTPRQRRTLLSGLDSLFGRFSR